MTEKEIRIQMALGTLEFDKLSQEEQEYWLIITMTRVYTDLTPGNMDKTTYLMTSTEGAKMQMGVKKKELLSIINSLDTDRR